MILSKPFIYVPKQRSEIFSEYFIRTIEAKYSAVYVRDSELRCRSFWSNQWYAIFYIPNPDVTHGQTKYIAAHVVDGAITMTNGISAIEPQCGLYHKNKFYYSRFTYDYVKTEDRVCVLDRGRYTNFIGPCKDIRKLYISRDILYCGVIV